MSDIADKIYAATGLTLGAEAAAKIGQFWFIINAPSGAFHGYPWTTRQDAQEALTAVMEAHRED